MNIHSLAFLCFMWDTQHAVLFCQSLCMSAFELRSNLPCSQALWEADSAESWHRLHIKQAPYLSMPNRIEKTKYMFCKVM